MAIAATRFFDAVLFTPDRHEDERGYFSETYSRRELAGLGITADFVQDNTAVSKRSGTVRGLHFQIPPFAQAKLVRIVRGAVFDVIVDLRPNSPHFGQYQSFHLSARDGRQLFVPIGFAHGLCTLEPDSEVAYKVTDYYSPGHDKGLRWDDPDLAIDWPVSPDEAVISPKDRMLPLFAALPAYFSPELVTETALPA